MFQILFDTIYQFWILMMSHEISRINSKYKTLVVHNVLDLSILSEFEKRFYPLFYISLYILYTQYSTKEKFYAHLKKVHYIFLFISWASYGLLYTKQLYNEVIFYIICIFTVLSLLVDSFILYK